MADTLEQALSRNWNAPSMTPEVAEFLFGPDRRRQERKHQACIAEAARNYLLHQSEASTR